MPIFECEKCLLINVPDEWTVKRKMEVANLVRRFGRLAAIPLYRPSGMDLTTAKGISLHITEKKGFCKCKAKLVEFEGNCPKCKRLNLDW